MVNNSPLHPELKIILYLAIILTSLSCNSPYLLQKIPVETLSQLGLEPNTDMLLRAAAEGDLPKIKELLAAGIDVNATTDLGYTPLHIAVLQGNAEVVAFLLANGADPRKPAVNNETACTLAREKEDQELITLLAVSMVKQPNKSASPKPVSPTLLTPPPQQFEKPTPTETQTFVKGSTIYPTNLRAEPSPFATLLVKIPKGTPILLYKEIITGYVKVKYQGQTGYVLEMDVDPKAMEKVKL